MPSTQKIKTRSNGAGSHAGVPYIPPVGRAPRKPVDEVRQGFLSAFRTLKETMGAWSSFAPLNEAGTKYQINKKGAAHIKDSVGFLVGKLQQIQSRIDEAIEG